MARFWVDVRVQFNVWSVRKRNPHRALYLWVMRAVNGARRILVHSERWCAAPPE